MADFQVGDVVRLKSGGPKMTVTQVDHNSAGVLSVWCSWFIQNNTKEEDGVFPVQAVETVAESSEPLQTRANTSRPKRI